MSQQPHRPLPPGPPHPPYPGGYAAPYAVPPPYGYANPPAHTPRSSGFNPWAAGAIGVAVGMLLSFLGMTLLPMLVFGLAFGGFGGFGTFEEGFSGPPPGRVVVAADGSVSGEALAEALEDENDYYYEDVSCPSTTRVATDVTTICRANDGVDDLRVVVVFEGDEGRFRTADLW
ncbi:hypothetical protein ACOCJ5_11440 [Knoellia sp. CPCC 206450]|uniref:hypothetical protein n=1 Tax=Knoellia tibetensis TaxID=3404798 RepID=UPI003B4347CC